jgi:60 kDa SS-A/Ro ribonucleoprotein
MAKTNTRAKRTKRAPIFTHEGARAAHLTPLQQLRRSVLSCLLWEREFYEDGVAIADRLSDAADNVSVEFLAALAVEARTKYHLRHVPLFLLLHLIRRASAALASARERRVADTKAMRLLPSHKRMDELLRIAHEYQEAERANALVASTIAATIQRADELAELVALYWGGNARVRPLAGQLKKGLAQAFTKFDAYQLAKYNRDAGVRLRDVLLLVNAKPKDRAQAKVWKQLANDTLPTPLTWETELSAGKDKRATFERLLREDRLGYLALLRNLRNMVNAGVDDALMRKALLARKGAERVLPFRFVAAARACPQLEPVLDEALTSALDGLAPLPGRTVVLIDVSRSMLDPLSGKSDLTRMDAAATLGAIIPGQLRVFTFSNDVVEVPPRRGMAGVDAIVRSQRHEGTRLFDAVAELNGRVEYDRLIVITDEQAEGGDAFARNMIQGDLSTMPRPQKGARGYVINIASAQNGVGYGPWVHLDGFSENVLRFIAEIETDDAA